MYSHVPTYILRRLKGEPVDFIVESEHEYGKRAVGWGIIIFSMFFSWIFLFPLLFSFPLFELFLTGHTSIIINGDPQNFTAESPWGPVWFMVVPSLISLVFIIPLAAIIVKGIIMIRKKGPWFAGTNKYLVEFSGDRVFYYLWNEFESTIETKDYKDQAIDIILTHKNLSKESIHKHGQLEQNKFGNLNIQINGKPIDVNELLKHRGISRNKIGLMKIKNGHFVLNMIRNNMVR